MKTVKLMGTAASLLVMGVTQSVAQDLTVGYFLEWPMPFQYAKAEGMYDEALGTSVNWVSFDSGTAMSAAMASGDVHMSVSQGVPPFVVATRSMASRLSLGMSKTSCRKPFKTCTGLIVVVVTVRPRKSDTSSLNQSLSMSPLGRGIA